MQRGGQAGDVEDAERSVAQRDNFARERAAGDDEHATLCFEASRPKSLGLSFVGCGALKAHGSRLSNSPRVQARSACTVPCRRASRALAVSTVTAASRQ